MSYDIDAFRVRPGRTAEEYLESGDREELDERPPTADERAETERVAAAPVAIDPGTERADGEEFIEISTESLQVSVYAQEAAIAIPYARVLNETGGFTISDPQTGEIVDLDALDLDGVARVYARGVHVARDITEQPKRPWWKLRRS